MTFNSVKLGLSSDKLVLRRWLLPMLILLLLLSLSACNGAQFQAWLANEVRVPIFDVGTEFVIADATWFEDEQTLFVFYHVTAREGLSENSQLELTYRTDFEFQPYVDLQAFAPVHTHVPTNCGPRSLCGSFSLKIATIPRDVRLQLRYHKEGELALEATTAFHVVAVGPIHLNRSAIVYGVFNEENTRVQWRLRHQFPAIRNEKATELGLRRDFTVENIEYGSVVQGRALFGGNPYGYAALGVCPRNFTALGSAGVTTADRAIFDTTVFPVESSKHKLACASATVKDAIGDFTVNALAQKNPETRDAFPSLRTPISEALPLRFLLETCNDPTSREHRAMQIQRLFLENTALICIDDWNTQGFADRLAERLTRQIDATRVLGQDMVLLIALNRQNELGVALRLEQALSQILPFENEQSSPRVSGAFIYDSFSYSIRSADVARYTLWCPSSFGGVDLGGISDTSSRDCALQPTTRLPLTQDLTLASLPIFPDEPQFEKFIEEYGTAQTGEMKKISIRAPIRTPTSTNVPVGDFGVATFFNNEAITPELTDGFSYCAAADSGSVVFKIDGFDDVIPLSSLGEVHLQFPQNRYNLGLLWEFPFLMKIDYESRLAAAVGLPDEIPLIAAFGLASPAEQFLGSQAWSQESFVIGNILEQCTDFCDHPTFDSSGVYNIDDLFTFFSNRCYRPRFPRLGDDGFPSDP